MMIDLPKESDTSFCLPKLKSITVLLYDFSTVNEKFLHSLLSLDFTTKLNQFIREASELGCIIVCHI